MRRSPLGCGGHSVQTVIASLNPILKGWYGYFQHAHRFTFSSIDGFVRRRLRAMMRRQNHRPGQGHTLNSVGRMPTSLILGCSRYPPPINRRANPKVETTDLRARRGTTAHRVRREGTAIAVPYPYPT
ncbi:MAG: group II intron maturase-specific domain-containing protein [Gammaproteobacteria bacterium]